VALPHHLVDYIRLVSGNRATRAGAATAAGSRFGSESVSLGRASGTVTLVQQTSFCLSAEEGDIRPGGAHGVYADDTRLLSRLELTVGDGPLELLSVAQDDASRATFVLRTPPPDGQADSRVLVLRRRSVDRGLEETIELRNDGRSPFQTTVTVDLEADLADLFVVKRGDRPATHVLADLDGDTVTFRRAGSRDQSRGVDRVEVHAKEATLSRCHARWTVQLPARGSWTGHLSVRPGGDAASAPGLRTLTHRREAWRHRTPTVRTDLRSLEVAYEASLRDLSALRLFGVDPGGLPVVAAGAPWFMTLFGRDSLLTAYMTLIADHDLAVGVLETLARLQGTRNDPDADEQPGRILHEVRYGGTSVYYGTADATPLFVVLLGECLRWGVAWARLEPLLPHADRALEWIERYGDRDGDGYVEYERMSPSGLVNQGWKDSADAIVFADGRVATPPIALCEVQGYVYAAYRARAALARRAGDDERARDCEQKARALRDRFDRDFWMPEHGYYALALDADKRQVDALASNMGHCLWTGIATAERARDVARRLVSPELFSGWGVRTLATSMAAYNPMSYHCGSVWPHDTAIAVAGLARYGFGREAATIGLALLDAADDQDGRLPELFTGLAQNDVPRPVAYPTSCSPQAWASASPLLVLRSLLRLEPDAASGSVTIDPVSLTGVRELVLDGVPVGNHRLRVTVAGDVSPASR
jgi:glycogen debranching enzyme